MQRVSTIHHVLQFPSPRLLIRGISPFLRSIISANPLTGLNCSSSVYRVVIAIRNICLVPEIGSWLFYLLGRIR
ncbi:hypothetical protein THAOC_06660 [Thalassiosira oceanica]|uniref:Uncharacterized protein n=1 Tax=Thalassiosira oceanica TaxID=159749 RepID=K0T404_THAOC|nr:hypothetical protein THAOC_06660 [Thalassiosira oceanica]|eukprot:EJK71859.1 hypothetical protein THAOC_06660 [Thalassiosira oceanica]